MSTAEIATARAEAAARHAAAVAAKDDAQRERRGQMVRQELWLTGTRVERTGQAVVWPRSGSA